MGWRTFRRALAHTLWTVVQNEDDPVNMQARPFNPEPWPVDNRTGEITVFGKLAVRMGWCGRYKDVLEPSDVHPGFAFVNVTEGDTKMFIIIINGDHPTILEDDKGLFPSDALVTKLRLMKQ